jgi:hypothetical protein
MAADLVGDQRIIVTTKETEITALPAHDQPVRSIYDDTL